METVIVLMLVVMYISMILGFLYFRAFLEDIHGHLFDQHAERRHELFESILMDDLKEELEQDKKKARKKQKVKKKDAN